MGDMVTGRAGVAIAISVVLVMVFVVAFARSRQQHAGVWAGVRQWNVSPYRNRDDAAQLLTEVHRRVVDLMRVLKHKYHTDETDDMRARCPDHPHGHLSDMVSHLLDNYDPDRMFENDPARSPETSYTVNKGATTYICLRDREDPTRLLDADLVMFVVLHECAHIANFRGWGHERDFWEAFKWLLHEADLAGVYTPHAFDRHPVDYCGLRIYYQPLHDTRLRSIWL